MNSCRDKVIRFALELLGAAQVVLYDMQSVPLWHSSDGRVTPISEMGDEHLINAIKRLRRGYESDERRQPAMRYLLRERNRRGLSENRRRW